MLRPVDTQTIMQQTQEIATKEAMHKQGQLVQQDQFAHTMQKEVQHKQSTVQSPNKDEKIDNDLNKNRKRHNQESSKKQSKKVKITQQDRLPKERHCVDIRI